MDRLNGNKYFEEVKNIISSLITHILEIPETAKEIGIRNNLAWMKEYIAIKRGSFTYNNNDIPDLLRGNVIIAKFGDNIGKEFNGQHHAIVLRDCKQGIDQIFVLPITSKRPKAYNPTKKGIYIEIPKISGFPGFHDPDNLYHIDNDKHWANILSIRNISKQRMIYPTTIFTVDGTILNIISATIKSQIALR